MTKKITFYLLCLFFSKIASVNAANLKDEKEKALLRFFQSDAQDNAGNEFTVSTYYVVCTL